MPDDNADLEEWTAGVLKRREFGQGAIGRWKQRKLELVTIWQLMHR